MIHVSAEQIQSELAFFLVTGTVSHNSNSSAPVHGGEGEKCRTSSCVIRRRSLTLDPLVNIALDKKLIPIVINDELSKDLLPRVRIEACRQYANKLSILHSRHFFTKEAQWMQQTATQDSRAVPRFL